MHTAPSALGLRRPECNGTRLGGTDLAESPGGPVKTFAGVLSLLLVAVAPSGLAQVPVLLPEAEVNASPAGENYSDDVALGKNGDFVVTWSAFTPGGDIAGRRFDAQTSPLGGDFLVNAVTTNDQLSSTIARDAPGRFVVVGTTTTRMWSAAASTPTARRSAATSRSTFYAPRLQLPVRGKRSFRQLRRRLDRVYRHERRRGPGAPLRQHGGAARRQLSGQHPSDGIPVRRRNRDVAGRLRRRVARRRAHGARNLRPAVRSCRSPGRPPVPGQHRAAREQRPRA